MTITFLETLNRYCNLMDERGVPQVACIKIPTRDMYGVLRELTIRDIYIPGDLTAVTTFTALGIRITADPDLPDGAFTVYPYETND